MTKERDLFQLEFTLAKLDIQLIISEFLQNKPQVSLVFFLIPGVHQNISDEYHQEFVKILHKHFIHQIHKVCWSISQPK
jgi:hypothetical protein